jgi:hypothetical protein
VYFCSLQKYLKTLSLKKYIVSSILLLSLSVILISWGGTGHRKISESSSLSFNQEMQGFMAWVTFIADHASDADYRKGSDPTEGPKHYIDIDNYSSFLTTGRIPQTYDSAVALYGYSFVMDNGILPWATERSFDSLRNCLERLDFAKAQIFAADLGHYVADGHMPMHITRNYDGQFTGNTGIHSRFESTMINAYVSEIIYTGYDAEWVTNVNDYILNYMYQSYPYVDSVLMADNYAKTFSTNTSSTAYKNALWDKSKSFTAPLFKNASHALADLIYTAWVQAGSPSLSSAAGVNPESISNAVLEQNMPNPFATSTHISYTLKENSKVILEVRNLSGQLVTTLVNDSLFMGNHTTEWVPVDVPAGMYYLILNTGKFIEIKKMVYSGGN